MNLSCFDLDYICILDTQGNLKQTHSPRITFISSYGSESEEEEVTDDINLTMPKICQKDDDGAVLVVDESNHSLLIMTAGGQRRRVRLNSRLRWPHDAVYWEDRLYVSNLVKLTMME